MAEHQGSEDPRLPEFRTPKGPKIQGHRRTKVPKIRGYRQRRNKNCFSILMSSRLSRRILSLQLSKMQRMRWKSIARALGRKWMASYSIWGGRGTGLRNGKAMQCPCQVGAMQAHPPHARSVTIALNEAHGGKLQKE